MGIYTVTYAINALSSIVKKRDAKLLNIITLGLLIFVSGTRYYMGGSDVYVYENVYENVASVGNILRYMIWGTNLGVNENYEPGFLLICSVAKTFHFTYFGFTLVYAAIFYVLVYFSLKRFVDSWAIFFALFMYKIMFYNTFISIRQGMTLAIFCFSLKYILDKKWVKYFICCTVAFLIHRGAIILFPLYFVQYVPMSKKILKYFAIGFAPTWLIRNHVDLSGVIQRVIDTIGYAQKSEGWMEATETISIIHTLECYIIILLCIYFFDYIIEKGEKAKLSLQMILFTLPIFTLCSNWIILTREKDYFVLFYGIVLGYIVTSEKLSFENKQIIKACIFLAAFIGMVRYVVVFDGGVLWHFTSFIFEGCSIWS